MRVLIGRSFFYEKENKIYTKGKSYSVNNEMANWITRKRLGEIIPIISENNKVKNLNKPPEDKMMRKNKTMRK